MLATAPQLHNRIAGHFAPAPIPVPPTPEGKQAAWGDAVFATMMFYQRQLAHPDERVAERAARAIFDLEKTRLRHGREVAGTMAEERADPSPENVEARPEPAWDEEEITANDEPAEFDERERAAIEAMVRHERYAPRIEEARTRLVGQGVDAEAAGRMAADAFRQLVGEAIRERRQRRAGTPHHPPDPAIRPHPDNP